jgi:hypothetical protein
MAYDVQQGLGDLSLEPTENNCPGLTTQGQKLPHPTCGEDDDT